MSKRSKGAEPAPNEGKHRPIRIVLDTNVFIRLSILEYVSRKGATKGFTFDWIGECGADIWLAPHQSAEIRRNARTVLDEHASALTAAQDTLVKSLGKVMTIFKPLAPPFIEPAKELKEALDKRKPVTLDWKELATLIDQRLAECKDLATHDPQKADIVSKRVEGRVARHDPPVSEKNKKDRRPYADCELWELVVALLETPGPVWFASADSDFLYDKDEKELHHVLQMETNGRELRFFPEDADLSRPYAIVAALEQVLPKKTEATHAAVDASSSVKIDDADFDRLWESWTRSDSFRDYVAVLDEQSRGRQEMMKNMLLGVAVKWRGDDSKAGPPPPPAPKSE